MGMSIGGLGGYNVYQAQPMNMSLSNQAPVSDVYDKHKAVGDIATVAPVVYPNAQEVKVGEVASTDGKEESLKVNQQFNQIASKFGSATVGYGRDLSGYSYGQSGGSFDAFA
ncbi:hypothetical protein [Butyrivibrio sp. AE3004]|uniref:hypothetical protein n=1 Tax=Butyrivibrio sp. AE3004 TaxID=1506994 RepID=UPI0004943160|nr:hypothetical protein [Butyrivibrio sp. AE3004]